jgi:hypothetical protein
MNEYPLTAKDVSAVKEEEKRRRKGSTMVRHKAIKNR